MDIKFPEQFQLLPNFFLPRWKRKFMKDVILYMIMHDRISMALSEGSYFNIQRATSASYAFGLFVGDMVQREKIFQNEKYKATWDDMIYKEGNRIMDLDP